MGPRLTVLAAVQLIVIAGAPGIALGEPTASELMKQAIADYKAGNYDAAAAKLERSYELEPKVEALFALAQAQRLGGNCEQAVVSYKKLLEETTDLATAKAVQSNLGLCPQAATVKPETEPGPTVLPEPAPAPPPRTIVREVRHTDGLGVAVLSIGALGAGASVGLLLRAQSRREDAATAGTLDRSIALHDRADRDRIIAIAVGGASAIAIGFGIYRLARGGGETATEVAITPTATGGMMVLSRSW